MGRKRQQNFDDIRRRVGRVRVQRDVCRNCHRCERGGEDEVGLHRTAEVELTRNKKAKFSSLGALTGGDVLLCRNCRVYFCNNNEAMSKEESVWPAFMWKVLTAARDDTVWQLIPLEWRGWWVDAVNDEVACLHRVTVTVPEAVVRDATKEVEEISSAFEIMEWKHLTDVWEKHCFLPFVRCPWGCSEFYHRTNDLPYDYFVRATLEQFSIKMYSQKSGEKWTRGMRKDYPWCEAVILHNNKWKCKSSVVIISGKGPRLLCCRFHSVRSVENYLHVPRNPTGSISIEGANQMSPAVPVVRMLRPTKAYRYCNSFALSRLVGNYNGIDSTYVSDQGRFDRNATDLTCRQDGLAVCG